MRTRTCVLLGTSLAAALAAGTPGLRAVKAQEDPAGKPPAPAAAKPQDAPAPAGDPAALVKSLGDPDDDVRRSAFDRLRSIGAPARGALEEGAKSTDTEVRWACQRLLRRLDAPAGAPKRGDRRLEFGDERDAAGPGTGGDRRPGAGFAFDDEEFRRSMEEMDRRMEELEKRFQDLPMHDFGGFRLEPGAPGAGAAVERRVIVDGDGERTDVRVAADGKVTVKILRKDAGGKAVDETFEAESLEALEKDHPEVHGKVKDLLGDRIDVRIGALPQWPRLPRPPRVPDAPRLGRLFERAEPKPVLGVSVSEVPPVLRTQLSLKEGEGIVVEEVLDGTPAERLGLRRHDVVLSVNGTAVGSVEDVRATVGKVEAGGDLRLRVLRGGRIEELAGKR